jgi:hypothetical protein
VPGPAALIASFTGPFGLYLHVPFCRSICPFCPYNKVLVREGLVDPYFGALRRELDLYGAASLRFESLYVGGGTPSLCLEEVGSLVGMLDVAHERAIEVMPNHVTPEAVSRLHELGFDYVSLGIQSFDARMLRHLGRLNTADDNRRALAATVDAFSCVNADLIFDVAFVEPDVFLRDFEECCRAGVDQISTYPLMHFGYTPLGKVPERPEAEAPASSPTAWGTNAVRCGPSIASAAPCTRRSRASATSAAAPARRRSRARTSTSTTSRSPPTSARSQPDGFHSRGERTSTPCAPRSTTPSGSCTRPGSTPIGSDGSRARGLSRRCSRRCDGSGTSSSATGASTSPNEGSTTTTTSSAG